MQSNPVVNTTENFYNSSIGISTQPDPKDLGKS